uniref:Transmembrane protein n=1 Tax=Caenorhabditis japonica TaxID=281687 RepID=A0A8R1ITC8_CAEJA
MNPMSMTSVTRLSSHFKHQADGKIPIVLMLWLLLLLLLLLLRRLIHYTNEQEADHSRVLFCVCGRDKKKCKKKCLAGWGANTT